MTAGSSDDTQRNFLMWILGAFIKTLNAAAVTWKCVKNALPAWVHLG